MIKSVGCPGGILAGNSTAEDQAVDSGEMFWLAVYRGTSLIRKRTPLGTCRRPMPRFLEASQGGGRFLMGEVPLQSGTPATIPSTRGGRSCAAGCF
jgi:hypothetical protein